MIEQNLEQLFDEKELARLLQVSVGTVRWWRIERRGPRYIKAGYLVRYRPSDVQEWLQQGTREPQNGVGS